MVAFFFLFVHVTDTQEAMHARQKCLEGGDGRGTLDVQPMLVEPLQVPAREPSDLEIHRHFTLGG